MNVRSVPLPFSPFSAYLKKKQTFPFLFQGLLQLSLHGDGCVCGSAQHLPLVWAEVLAGVEVADWVRGNCLVNYYCPPPGIHIFAPSFLGPAYCCCGEKC